MKPLNRTRIAFFDFAGCEGCQLGVIDALQTDLDLLNVVEIVQFREAMSERDEDYQIAFVEGSCTRSSDEERLLTIRAQAQLVVALGACAHLGGLNAARNQIPLEQARRIVYGPGGKFYESGSVRPISAVIPVDAVVPGCPINRAEFVRTVKLLLQGRKPKLPDVPVCAECKLRENSCVVWGGHVCLGAVTRAGCEAICPAYGQGCTGCRGLIDEPNLRWLEAAMYAHGVSQETFSATTRLFLSYQLADKEVNGNGRH